MHTAEINVHPLTAGSKSETIQDKDHHIFKDKDGHQHDIMLLELHNIKGTHKAELPERCPKLTRSIWYYLPGTSVQIAGHGPTEPKQIGETKSEFSINALVIFCIKLVYSVVMVSK